MKRRFTTVIGVDHHCDNFTQLGNFGAKHHPELCKLNPVTRIFTSHMSDVIVIWHGCITIDNVGLSEDVWNRSRMSCQVMAGLGIKMKWILISWVFCWANTWADHDVGILHWFCVCCVVNCISLADQQEALGCMWGQWQQNTNGRWWALLQCAWPQNLPWLQLWASNTNLESLNETHKDVCLQPTTTTNEH